MKIVYTDEALRDLDEVLTYIALNYPTVSRPFALRLRAIERRIGRWPKSAEEVEQRPGVRVVPFIQFPYKIFYRITEEAVEILHIHHAARQEPRVGGDRKLSGTRAGGGSAGIHYNQRL